MRLGIADVDSWLDTISPEQWNEFMALESLEPSNAWEHTGTVAAAAANAAVAWGGEPRKPSDFMPTYRRPSEPDNRTDPNAWEAALRSRYGGR